MPASHRSDWEITTPFRFVHLYLSDERLRSAFSQIHDCDARRLDLREENFADKPELAGPLAELASALRSRETLQAETAIAELIGRLPGRAPCVRGGLPAHLLRRVDDYIAAHLSGAIHLDDLAGLAGLSGFHFHQTKRAGHRFSARLLSLNSPAPRGEAARYSAASLRFWRFSIRSSTTPGSARVEVSPRLE